MGSKRHSRSHSSAGLATTSRCCYSVPLARFASSAATLAASGSLGQKRGSLIARALVPAIRARAAHGAAGCHLGCRAAGRTAHIYTRRPAVRHHPNTYFTVARLRGTTGSLRATMKNTFSNGTAPATSPHFAAMLQNRDPRSRHATQLRHMTAPLRRPMGARGACAPTRARNSTAANFEP